MSLPEQPRSEPASLASLVNRIAGWVAHGGGVITAGDSAALRRMDPRKPASAFFKISGVVLADQLHSHGDARHEQETRWSAIIVGLAYMANLHRPEKSFGRALVDAGFSELRFSRLLRADGDRLVDDLPMVARFLAAKQVPADWAQAAWLILSAERSDEEKMRRSLARDYYSTLAKKYNT